MKKTILVTGGAGYIGSHTVKELAKKDYDIVVVDSLENGYRNAVTGGTFVQADLRNKEQLNQVFVDHKIDAVIHFAAYASVPDSVANPAKYFENNLIGGLNLLECMRAHKVNHIVFSSTAAVYGEPKQTPLVETADKEPTSPYGLSKWQFEQILNAYDAAYAIRSVSLRYFCAAGADPEGMIGEDHEPETHIIPLTIATALGKRESVNIYGTDYPTPDGTGVRDFIHVVDLANIHIAALSYLAEGGVTNAFNCGNEKGYSVREVIDTVQSVTGKSVTFVEKSRRSGDPTILIADSSKLQQTLSFKNQHSDLETIIKTSWQWHQSHPEGYGEKKDHS